MKTIQLSMLGLALGFVAARWLPASAGDPVKKPAPAAPRVTFTPAKPARGLSMEGDWKPAADAWAKEDPAGFYEWLVARGTPPEEGVLHALFSEWVKRDPDAAFEAAFNLPGDYGREHELLMDVLNHSLGGIAGLKTAIKWAPFVDEQTKVWSSPPPGWMKDMPVEEIKALLAENGGPTGSYVSMLAGFFAKDLAKTDLPAALDWMRTLDHGRRGVFSGIMETWAETDPKSALKYLAEEGRSSEQWDAHAPLAKLAETDPRAAMDWWEQYRGVPDPNCVRKIFQPWCDRNPVEARDYAMSIEDPALRRHCVSAWVAKAKTADVMEAYRSTEDSATREALVTSLTQVGRGGSDDKDLRDLVAGGSLPEVTPAMAASISRNMAQDTPAEALQWTATLPERLQSAGMVAVMARWKDKVAAAQAVENLPDGPAREAARKALAPKSN